MEQRPASLVWPIRLSPLALLVATVMLSYACGDQSNDRIVFSTDRDNDAGAVYIMNGDGSNPTRLTNSPDGDNDPAWSPDGTQVAFTRLHPPDNFEIYIVNADGTGEFNLTDHRSWDLHPEWSPDGRRIAFQSYRFDIRVGRSQWHVYVIDVDSGAVTQLTTMSGDSPAWSPDGSRIAFSGQDGEIYLMNSDGSDVVRLTDRAHNDSDPTWSPDGTKLAFTSTLNGNDEIFVMNIDGSNAVNLTKSPEREFDPAWAPDGARLAFTRLVDASNLEIFVMNADGSEQINITDNPSVDHKADWLREP
ncbi:MAG: PD40 domain-containing protein [Chloroflexi bacterium]|nr:PD40 domain-containing protein [Chloroflexota bacterium]